jgi:three-Cys-motif partner protein
MQVPDEYKGREQALIKHKLLWGYLEQLIMIIGHSRARCITFVDCFAGPWQDESDTLSGTSIGISLEIMRRCRNSFTAIGRSVPRFRALYIEKNRGSFDRLQSFLGEPRAGIETKALRGEFIDLEEEILDWCGPDAFVFFFIDPKGWKDMSMPKLRPLLERPNSEFLINLMYDFVNRAVSQEKFAEDMHDLFGEDISSAVNPALSSKERERALMALYRQRLRAALPSTGERTYTSAMPILRDAHPRPAARPHQIPSGVPDATPFGYQEVR